MLYLFNSAFRPKYAVNVLNTLFLPVGEVNEYRFTFQGPQNYVEPGMLEGITDKESLLIYIDRHNPSGFFFHPLRKATFLSVEQHQGQAHFRMQLGDYVYPKNKEQFQDSLRRTLQAERIPQLAPDNSPDSPARGYFALQGNAVAHDSGFLTGDDAWVNCTEEIAKTQAYSSLRPVFARGRLVDIGGSKHFEVSPRVRGTRAYYSLARGCKYRLQLNYRFPYQDQDPTASLTAAVNCTSLLLPISPTTIEINSRNCVENFDFQVKRYAEEPNGGIALTISSNASAVNSQAQLPATPMIAAAGLSIEMRESRLFYPALAVAVLAYGIFGASVASDWGPIYASFSADYPALSSGRWSFIHWTWYWLLSKYARILGEAGQALVLLVTLRLFGKKVL